MEADMEAPVEAAPPPSLGAADRSAFVLEQEEDDDVQSEEDFHEEQCPLLVMCGHMSCAKQFRAQYPEPVRFGTSSFFGSGIMFALNELTLLIVPEEWMPNPGITIAYALSYGASVSAQHWLHATLVYGWKTSYLEGLKRTYAGYFVSWLVGIPINEGLVVIGFSAQVAWGLTLFLTGCANYFLFQRLLGGSKRPPATPRGLYNPPARAEVADNPLNEGMLGLEHQRLERAQNGTGSEMADEYRRLQEQNGVSKPSVWDRLYMWVASL